MLSRIIALFVVVTLVGYTAFKFFGLWPALGGEAVFLAILLFAAMLGSLLIGRLRPAAFNRAWFRAWAWAGSFAMAFWTTFLIFALPTDLVRIVVELFTDDGNPTAAVFFRNADLAVFGLSILTATLGFLEVLRGPYLKAVTVRVPNLAAGLRGLRIAQISDLHVGPTIRRRYVERVVRRTRDAKPDLVVYTGDIVDAPPAAVAGDLRPIADLRPRLGAYYVTGNHEYYWDAPGIVKRLQPLGIVPLLNANVSIPVGDARLLVAGVTDPMGAMLSKRQAPDAARAAKSAEKNDFRILLAHRPDPADAAALGFDLQLSGHTHAGQFFPFTLFIGLAHRYTRGLYRHENMWVYVNPGTGYWGPANRFAVRPEITLVTLENA